MSSINGIDLEPIEWKRVISSLNVHSEVIKGWLDGGQVQIWSNDEWLDCYGPMFHSHEKYRINPKIINLWVNVYQHFMDPPGKYTTGVQTYSSEQEAVQNILSNSNQKYLCTKQITMEV